MITTLDLQRMKAAQQKIAMITCYDYTSACIVAQTDIDCVLVGDSAAMVMHGADHTTSATMEQMLMHTAAVARGLIQQLLITDLPFMSYHKSLHDTLSNVEQLIRAGAHAVKLEGADDTVITAIKASIAAGVPVMGHLGLTPQHVHQLGGYHCQGKSDSAELQLINDAQRLAEAGCFAIVLECIPAPLAQTITQQLSIPTIGIGAGVDTDGQVLVFQDLLGLQSKFKPKFVKQFCDAEKLFIDSIQQYTQAVKNQTFPEKKHSYSGRKDAVTVESK